MLCDWQYVIQGSHLTESCPSLSGVLKSSGKNRVLNLNKMYFDIEDLYSSNSMSEKKEGT
jgi:hypothetical protein